MALIYRLALFMFIVNKPVRKSIDRKWYLRDMIPCFFKLHQYFRFPGNIGDRYARTLRNLLADNLPICLLYTSRCV